MFSLVPHPSCQQGYASFPAQSCGATGRGHIFTDCSSSGSGALQRSGCAVVAFDEWGNLKSAAYGAVPIDVLPEQTSLRCGRLRLLPWPGQSPWTREAEAQGPGSPTTRSRQSRSRATRRKGTCRQGAPLTYFDGETQFADVFGEERGTHTLWLLPPWPSKLQDDTSSVPRRREVARLPGTRAKQQAKRSAGGASDRLGVRLARTHRTLALLARQSTRSTLLQGTQPQSGQVKQRRRAVPELPEASRWVLLSNAD